MCPFSLEKTVERIKVFFFEIRQRTIMTRHSRRSGTWLKFWILGPGQVWCRLSYRGCSSQVFIWHFKVYFVVNEFHNVQKCHKLTKFIYKRLSCFIMTSYLQINTLPHFFALLLMKVLRPCLKKSQLTSVRHFQWKKAYKTVFEEEKRRLWEK